MADTSKGTSSVLLDAGKSHSIAGRSKNGTLSMPLKNGYMEKMSTQGLCGRFRQGAIY